ncbi:MAG: IS3 family transposase [Bacteroidota bacterium]
MKKSLATFQPERLSIYQFIRDHQGEFSVARMCRLFELSRSSFYDSAKLVQETDLLLKEELRKVFWFHKRRYGARRLAPELRDRGFQIGRAKARRLMQELGLKAIQPRSFVPKTTQSLSHFTRSTNLLLGRKFPGSINEIWVGDITYLPLEKSQWAYLSVWMDLYSRFIVGWKVADHMRTELVLESFEMAWKRRNPGTDLILHSDGGSQYAAKDFRESISRLSVLQSMTRKDNHYDNAFIESHFSRLKAELLEGGLFRNIEDAQREVFDYIEAYYNTIRRHSAIGYVSPMKFENKLFLE